MSQPQHQYQSLSPKWNKIWIVRASDCANSFYVRGYAIVELPATRWQYSGLGVSYQDGFVKASFNGGVTGCENGDCVSCLGGIFGAYRLALKSLQEQLEFDMARFVIKGIGPSEIAEKFRQSAEKSQQMLLEVVYLRNQPKSDTSLQHIYS